MKLNPSLVTGVEEIDSQHLELITRIEQLSQAAKSGKSAQELIPTLLFIKKYVAKHFADEEKLQLSCNYPKYKEHKAAHTAFSREAEKLFDKCDKEGVNLLTILETNKVLYDWLINHIHKVDVEFAQYYRTHKK